MCEIGFAVTDLRGVGTEVKDEIFQFAHVPRLWGNVSIQLLMSLYELQEVRIHTSQSSFAFLDNEDVAKWTAQVAKGIVILYSLQKSTFHRLICNSSHNAYKVSGFGVWSHSQYSSRHFTLSPSPKTLQAFDPRMKSWMPLEHMTATWSWRVSGWDFFGVAKVSGCVFQTKGVDSSLELCSVAALVLLQILLGRSAHD